MDDFADRYTLVPVDEVDHRQGVPEPVRVGVGEGVFVLVDPEDGSRHAFLVVEDDDVFRAVDGLAPFSQFELLSIQFCLLSPLCLGHRNSLG